MSSGLFTLEIDMPSLFEQFLGPSSLCGISLAGVNPIGETAAEASRREEIACGLVGAQQDYRHMMERCLHGAVRSCCRRLPVNGNAG